MSPDPPNLIVFSTKKYIQLEWQCIYCTCTYMHFLHISSFVAEEPWRHRQHLVFQRWPIKSTILPTELPGMGWSPACVVVLWYRTHRTEYVRCKVKSGRDPSCRQHLIVVSFTCRSRTSSLLQVYNNLFQFVVTSI